MCLSDFIYDFYYLSRKKQIILISCAVLVVCLLVAAVCFYVYMAIRINTPDYEPDIIHSAPDGQYELVIREEAQLHASAAVIYIRKPGQDKWYNSWKEQHIGNTLSDECLPLPMDIIMLNGRARESCWDIIGDMILLLKTRMTLLPGRAC